LFEFEFEPLRSWTSAITALRGATSRTSAQQQQDRNDRAAHRLQRFEQEQMDATPTQDEAGAQQGC
jgi:hypothetical protein